MHSDLSTVFPQYSDFGPLVPIWCVTPGPGGTIHRFFDTTPFSPSGRYLGLTRLLSEDRLPSPGDLAEIILVDLRSGKERVVAVTRGWDTQLGAQVQWGATDRQLFFNDIDTTMWKPFGVELDPASGARKHLDGPIYMISPDGNWAASPCLLRTGATQPGYGIIVPSDHVPTNDGAPADDGIYVTRTASGACRLLVSLREIVETARPPLSPEEYRDGDFYAFHVKWNPQGDRLMLVLRWVPRQKSRQQRSMVITMRADGSNIRVAIPASEWDKGGHHPNWCPDGETVMMNLRIGGSAAPKAHARFLSSVQRRTQRALGIRRSGMRLVRARYDGSDYQVMVQKVVGSGHPSMHPNGRHVITDAYPNEAVAYGDGTSPIRLIDLDTARVDTLVRINTVPPYRGPRNEMRVDPHPAWDRQFRRIAFNGCTDGTRRVYMADLTRVLDDR